jgi:hypothetical protein
MANKKHKSKDARVISIDELVPGQGQEQAADSDRTDFTMLKCKCLKCGLHSILCTWHPDRHSEKTIYYPECGQNGEGLLLWQEHVNQPISAIVPGNAQLANGTVLRKAPWDN